MIHFLLLQFMILWQSIDSNQEQLDKDQLNEIWKDYGKVGVLHDLEHLKEEASKVLFMQQNEKISLDDSAFYYTKLHDFNNDGGLDGLELLYAVKHSLVHTNSSYESVNLEQLAGLVDNELSLMDLNFNGIVDYGEIYTYMNRAKAMTSTPPTKQETKN